MDDKHRHRRTGRLVRAAGALTFALALVSCGSDHQTLILDRATSAAASSSTPSESAQLEVASFVAQPATVSLGQSAVLIWQVNDSDAQLSIDQGVGAVTGTSEMVTPTATTTYTLTATNAAGTKSAQVTVTIGVAGTNGASSDGGADELAGAWTNATGNLAGLSSQCGNMSFVSVRPDKDVVIAGVAIAGLWASTVATDTKWDRLGNGAGSDVIVNRPSSFVYEPDHPGSWWVSGIYAGGGVYKTTDGGVTFKQVGDVVHSDAVSIDLTDPARMTMLSGRHETSILDRSTDGGATWNTVDTLPADIGFATAPLVIDAQTFLLGTVNGAKSGIYRSTDQGASWTLVRPGGVSGKALVAKDRTIYWVLNGGDVLASTDEGATWTVQTAGWMSSGTLVEMPDGRLAGTVRDRIATSSDKGKTWRSVGPTFPYAENGMTYSAARNAFYVWHFDCNFNADDPVLADAIMRWDVDA